MSHVICVNCFFFFILLLLLLCPHNIWFFLGFLFVGWANFIDMDTGENESTLSPEEIIDGTVQQSLKEKDSANPLEQPVEVDDRINSCDASINMENGIHRNLANDEESIDELTQLVIELSFQNEYLKSEIGDLKLELCKPKPLSDEERKSGPHVGSSEQDSSLHEQIKCLQKEIQAQKETQMAAEDALEHLRMAYSEADGKVQELTTKLIEG